MFTATVNGFERWAEVNTDIEALCVAALRDAADTAAAVAQQAASIHLDLDVTVGGDIEGFTGGIRSSRTGKRGVRLAPIFDEGTLGRRRGKLKHRRRETWQVKRAATSYQAHRHPITADEGIPAERFFPKARADGRRALLARIDRGA